MVKVLASCPRQMLAFPADCLDELQQKEHRQVAQKQLRRCDVSFMSACCFQYLYRHSSSYSLLPNMLYLYFIVSVHCEAWLQHVNLVDVIVNVRVERLTSPQLFLTAASVSLSVGLLMCGCFFCCCCFEFLLGWCSTDFSHLRGHVQILSESTQLDYIVTQFMCLLSVKQTLYLQPTLSLII